VRGACSRRARDGARRGALALALVASLHLGASPGPPVAVYGAELFSDGATERVLVFADRPVEAHLERVDAETCRVWIEGAVLDDSAPRRIAPPAPGEVSTVELSEAAGASRPTVLIEIHGSGAIGEAALSREAALLAVEIPLRAPPPGEGIVLALRDTPLAEAVRTLGDATGTRFVFDERLAGRVTLAAPAAVSPAEALGLLDAALALAGFVALPAPDGTRRVLPADLAPGSAPWKPGSLAGGAEAPVATLVRLDAARAEEAVAALEPWLGGALAWAHAPGNAVLLAGSEARLHGILAILRALDEAAAEALWVRRIRHRSATELAEWLRADLEPGAGLRPRARVFSDAGSNALVVQAPPEELARIRARVARLDQAEAQGGPLRVLRVRHADPQALAERLRTLAADAAAAGVPEGGTLAMRAISVALDAPTRSLLVAADAETQDVVEDLVRELDRPPQRISVEAMVLEVESDASRALGFDAFLPLVVPKSPGDTSVVALLDPTGSGLFQPGSAGGPAGAARYTREPLAIPIVGPNGVPTEVLVPRESAVVTADGHEIRSRVLMRPHLLVASGEEQEIFAGDQVPIPVAASEAAGELQVRQTVERRDVGVRLRVRPTLGEAGRVRLEVDLEVSRVAPGIVLGAGVGPVLRQRRLQSTIGLGDGEIAVVGLGRERSDESNQRGTPLLADAPGIGALFRATQERRREVEIAIAVRARVLRDDAELAADSIRHRLGVERSLARLGPLGAEAEAPWGVLAATRDDEVSARELAGSLEREGFAARVVAWTWQGRERFDVYATGFTGLADAAGAATRLAARGLSAELVPLPVPGA
jgi:general secretion pathway protein D